MNFKYIDIHSHLNLKPLAENIEEVISHMREKGVATIAVGVDLETSEQAIELAEKFPDVVLGATIGLHPTDNLKEVFDLDAYKKLGANPKTLAIGECGLDYYRDQREETKVSQKELFKKHVLLAKEIGKPLMIHARPSKGSMDAYEDVIVILESEKVSANFHFFVGDVSIAKKILENGWTASFDGPITFSRDYDEVIKFLPIENIMAETDAPFAAPAPYRGKTCEPWMVEEVYKKIAEIKDLSLPAATKAIQENIKRVLFKI